MKRVFSSFVQKRIKPISSGTVKTGKKQAGKNALEKTANLARSQPFFGIPNFGFLIDALKVMPSSINASNGPPIGTALL